MRQIDSFQSQYDLVHEYQIIAKLLERVISLSAKLGSAIPEGWLFK